MIAMLAGTLRLKEADRVVVMTGSGIAYECFVPTRSLESLPREGQPVELHTHLSVREDAQTLFGFATPDERRVFQRLISITGVGPKMAMAMLSQLSAERIVRAIREHDIAALSSVSGVGKKTAERLILELKDKTGDLGATASPVVSGSEAAIKALQKLGYSQIEADEAVRQALVTNGKRETADIVRAALGFLASR